LELEAAIKPVLNVGQVAQTLHHLMEEVTKEAVTAETVGAACQCAARLTDLVRVCIEAAKLQRGNERA
jgi:hypothetical protein